MLAKSKRNLCDDCSTSEIDGTCSVSYLKDVPKNERKYEKACRCNPNEFAFNKKELNPQRCNDGDGCPDNEDGFGEGTCHMSYPWYDPAKFKSDDKAPRCKYPLEPVDDEDDDSDDGENFPVVEPNQNLRDTFTQQIDVFGVLIVGTSGVPVDKLRHAATVMAEYLDNDEDGSVDDPAVVEAMRANNALLVMFETPNEAEDAFDNGGTWLDQYWVQDLYATETNPPGQFDAALEEVLHLIQTSGYRFVHDDLDYTDSNSGLLEAVDTARGGTFYDVPDTYPEEAWFHYDDETCNRRCMAVEYFYWGLTSLLGAQEYRCNNIAGEWELCTAQLLEDGDVLLYELLTRPEHNLPTTIPDGVYTATMDYTPPEPEEPEEPKNGEEVCEGHGFTQFECESKGCCSFDDGQCYSKVGGDICEPSGEDVCEGHNFDVNQCESISCCHYNDNLGQCFSSVGGEVCNATLF